MVSVSTDNYPYTLGQFGGITSGTQTKTSRELPPQDYSVGLVNKATNISLPPSSGDYVLAENNIDRISKRIKLKFCLKWYS